MFGLGFKTSIIVTGMIISLFGIAVYADEQSNYATMWWYVGMLISSIGVLLGVAGAVYEVIKGGLWDKQ